MASLSPFEARLDMQMPEAARSIKFLERGDVQGLSRDVKGCALVPSFAIIASSGMQIQDLVDQYEELNKILDSIAG